MSLFCFQSGTVPSPYAIKKITECGMNREELGILTERQFYLIEAIEIRRLNCGKILILLSAGTLVCN